MQIKCEYCGSFISDKDEVCEQCGAVNANFNRSSDGTPKTIEELKAWYAKKKLPPEEVTRFFIGKNYTEPRAFGIYEENGEFIVYKNKDNGQRAIRYSGTDEAYAVNELYLKLKSEILNQKANNLNKKKSGETESKKSSFMDKIYTCIGFALAGAFIIGALTTAFDFVRDIPYVGKYYKNGSNVYYCDSYVDDSWYLYDYDYEDYIPVELPAEMADDIQDYKVSIDDEWNTDVERFEDTPTGQYIESLDDSSDSDYDWDSSDSWDSDSSDWDSDW